MAHPVRRTAAEAAAHIQNALNGTGAFLAVYGVSVGPDAGQFVTQSHDCERFLVTVTALEDAPTGGGTVVAETVNCQVVLTDFGFYARCTRCPWVSDYTHAKHRARAFAESHDNA